MPGSGNTPCALIAAVFSELSNTAHHQGLEAMGIAWTIVNRALDHDRGHVFHNSGNAAADVTRQATSSQIQGTGNSQYSLATEHMESGAPLPDEATQAKFDLVVRAASVVYNRQVPDPTHRSVFMDHGSTMPPSNTCGAKIVVTLGEAQFSACTR